MKDALGNELNIGDTVALGVRRGNSGKLTFHVIRGFKGNRVLTYTPSMTWSGGYLGVQKTHFTDAGNSIKLWNYTQVQNEGMKQFFAEVQALDNRH